MRAVLLGDQADALIAKRQQLGLDRYDEIWAGEYHVAPDAHAFHGQVIFELMSRIRPAVRERGLVLSASLNIGTPTNCRIPDFAVHYPGRLGVWNPTAALVGEVLSPGDEAWAKFPFYWEHRVEEILIADYERRTVRMFQRTSEIASDWPFRETDRSELLGLSTVEIAEIDWPLA